MPFAHGGVAEGPNYEALVLAVPMVVVGIILFVQKSTKPVVSVMLVLGGVALALGGFTFLDTGDDHDDAQAAGQADARYTLAVQGLCDARSELADDDPEAARASFYDDSHVALHDIADRLAGEDRSAAAELLEAKQAVESGFESGTDVVLVRALDELIISTVQGLASLDEPVGGCA